MMILMRCDAHAGIGFGHLARCLTLADAAQRAGHLVAIAGTVDGGLAMQALVEAGVPRWPIKPGYEAVVSLADRVGADLVHIDSYDDYAALHSALDGRGVLLSSMADGAFGLRRADLAIDPTPGADASRVLPLAAASLQGERWLPVRRSFADRPRRAESRAEAPRVLVVMGGFDSAGALGPVLRLLERVTGLGKVTAIVPDDRRVDLAAQFTNVEFVPPRSDLATLAGEVDLIVTAAGTSLWEFSCLGLPIVALAVVDNQVDGLERAVSRGAAIGLGKLADVVADPATAAAIIEMVIAEPSRLRALGRRAAATVDGLGADRIVAAWSAIGLSRIAVRLATWRDSDLLFEWRNDSTTRAASFNTSPVARHEHDSWLAAVLADPDRRLMVGEIGQRPTGTVRLDRLAPNDTGDERWELSFTIAPAERRRGLAAELIRGAERNLLAARATSRPAGSAPGPVTFVARTRPTNVASLRTLESLGYVKSPDAANGSITMVRQL